MLDILTKIQSHTPKESKIVSKMRGNWKTFILLAFPYNNSNVWHADLLLKSFRAIIVILPTFLVQSCCIFMLNIDRKILLRVGLWWEEGGLRNYGM
jgi:hypothetical protein